LSESVIETGILRYLNDIAKVFAFKIKDNTKCVDGIYRSPRPFEIRGVPDICCLLNNGITVWFEVKTETGKLSVHQEDFFAKCRERNHHCFLVRNIKEVRAVMQTFTALINP
jgi:hypothetical protein